MMFHSNCTDMFAWWIVFSFTVTPIYSDAEELREDAQMAIYHNTDGELKMKAHCKRGLMATHRNVTAPAVFLDKQ